MLLHLTECNIVKVVVTSKGDKMKLKYNRVTDSNSMHGSQIEMYGEAMLETISTHKQYY